MALVEATSTWFYEDADGVPSRVHEGDVFDGSDPVVRKWPGGFRPLEPRTSGIEQATAKPGEKRTRSKTTRGS